MTIQQPGKFEGEHESVPHFYAQTLDGCTDDVFVSDTQYSFIVIDADDRAKFPDVTEYGLMLWERSDGFVMTEWYATKEDYDRAYGELETESAEESDEDESEDE